MTAAAIELPLLVGTVEVRSVTRLSPSFVRVELGGALLDDLGVGETWFDQRIKLVFPGTPGVVPDFTGADERWYTTWLARPVAERGHMRTYTVRDVVRTASENRLVVDIVVHEGATGPGNSWALAAAPGDQLAVMAPRRGHAYGGIEWDPAPGRRLLLAGDETALPAVAAILEQVPAASRGTAFVEVPYAADVQDLDHPVGVEVVWLPREGAEHGSLLHAAVVAHLGTQASFHRVVEEEVDPDLWETPTYSSSGEDTAGSAPAAGPHADLYAWIAGESKVVTGLRRHLVRDLGIDRHQVAFMGYWRRGVSMGS
jgi:NADPH-dependent ferric siderophore reductase